MKLFSFPLRFGSVLDKNVKRIGAQRLYLLFASVRQANTIDRLGERYEVIQKCEFDINRWRLFEIRRDWDCRHNSDQQRVRQDLPFAALCVAAFAEIIYGQNRNSSVAIFELCAEREERECDVLIRRHFGWKVRKFSGRESAGNVLEILSEYYLLDRIKKIECDY